MTSKRSRSGSRKSHSKRGSKGAHAKTGSKGKRAKTGSKGKRDHATSRGKKMIRGNALRAIANGEAPTNGHKTKLKASDLKQTSNGKYVSKVKSEHGKNMYNANPALKNYSNAVAEVSKKFRDRGIPFKVTSPDFHAAVRAHLEKRAA